MTSALTPKQRRFCEEFIVDLNGTQAAIRAGYSAKTANPQAARLLAKASVAAHVAKLQAEAAARNEISVDKVISMLAASYTDAKAANQHGPAVRAAELLGKRLGMFRDRVEVQESGLTVDQTLERLGTHDPILRERLELLISAKNTFS